MSDPKTTANNPEPAQPAPGDAKPLVPDEAQAGNTGTGAASALARLKLWERSRARLREGARDKPGGKGGGGGC